MGSDHETFTHLQAGLESGLEHDLANGGSLKAKLRAGVIRYLGDPSVSSDIHLTSAPAGTADFRASTDLYKTQAAVGAAIDFFSGNNFTVSASVGATFSENTLIQMGDLQARFRFLAFIGSMAMQWPGIWSVTLPALIGRLMVFIAPQGRQGIVLVHRFVRVTQSTAGNRCHRPANKFLGLLPRFQPSCHN